ncbi:MAG: hypothetical protein ACT4NL_07600 [Pseudomarimonas sp.]
MIPTLQSPSGRHRGGRISVERLAQFISREFHAADRLTTLVDFYGVQDAEGRSRDALEERVAKLAGGVAVIKVGASTEVEMKSCWRCGW